MEAYIIVLCSIQQRHLKQLHIAHLCDPHDKRKERMFWIAYSATNPQMTGINEMVLETLERDMCNES